MLASPAVTGQQRLAALVVVVSLEPVELAHVQLLEEKLHRPRDDAPSMSHRHCLTIFNGLSQSQLQHDQSEECFMAVCMTLPVSAGVSCSRRAMRCSLERTEQSWDL